MRSTLLCCRVGERWSCGCPARTWVPIRSRALGDRGGGRGRRAGPGMLAVERTEDRFGPLAVCVEERVTGRPLEEVEDIAARRRLTGVAGEVVAALHTVAMPGCGFVRPDGTVPVPTWAPVMRLSRLDPP